MCSGGRYDGLVAQLGGELTPAMGWALGEERIIGLMQAQGIQVQGTQPDVYVALVGEIKPKLPGWRWLSAYAIGIESVRIETNCGGGSFKSQLKRADKSGARFAVILGDSETEQQVAGLKNLRVDEPQTQVAWAQLAGELQQRLSV